MMMLAVCHLQSLAVKVSENCPETSNLFLRIEGLGGWVPKNTKSLRTENNF